MSSEVETALAAWFNALPDGGMGKEHFDALLQIVRSASPSIGRVGGDAARALGLLAAEDERNDKIHDLLETIREQIRLEVAPEHRPDGLMKNIQNAVYAMRGRMRLMNDAAITSPLSSLVSHGYEGRRTFECDVVNEITGQPIHLLKTEGLEHYGPPLYREPQYVSRDSKGKWKAHLVGQPAKETTN